MNDSICEYLYSVSLKMHEPWAADFHTDCYLLEKHCSQPTPKFATTAHIASYVLGFSL